jgi:hypothetical protein
MSGHGSHSVTIVRQNKNPRPMSLKTPRNRNTTRGMIAGLNVASTNPVRQADTETKFKAGARLFYPNGSGLGESLIR